MADGQTTKGRSKEGASERVLAKFLDGKNKRKKKVFRSAVLQKLQMAQFHGIEALAAPTIAGTRISLL